MMATAFQTTCYSWHSKFDASSVSFTAKHMAVKETKTNLGSRYMFHQRILYTRSAASISYTKRSVGYHHAHRGK